MNPLLDALFRRWRLAHIDDADAENTTVPGIRRDAFLPDGLLDNQADHAKVLFLLKESHVEEGEDNIFWFKALLDGESWAKDPHQYLPKLEALNAYLGNGTIRNAAYMNLNKRGGTSSTNACILDRYAYAFRDYIAEEINLIDPRIVVCMGCFGIAVRRVLQGLSPRQHAAEPARTISHVYHDTAGNRLFVDMVHPAAPAFIHSSPDKYLAEFRTRFSLDELTKLT